MILITNLHLPQKHARYIDHVPIIRSDGSKPFAVMRESIEITPLGIEYLQENKMMKKVFESLKNATNLGFSVASLFI